MITLMSALVGQAVSAAEPLEFTFFYSSTCPHCKEERAFLDVLEEKYPELKVNGYEIAYHSENQDILVQFYQEYGVPKEEWGMVPVLFTPQKYFIGFDKKIGENIEACLVECLGGSASTSAAVIKVPILGKISLSRLSPLTLAVVMGGLDGFNACAMVALGFLLTSLIATGAREKVLWIGGTFILVSGIVYFVFITASFNLFLVLEKINFITNLVGLIIILFAAFMLKDYFHGIICKVCQVDAGKGNWFSRWEQKMFSKMQALTDSKKSLILMLAGVSMVAAGINLVELVCSFGFPLAFIKILTSFNLSSTSYYFYLFIYVILYMLDDFIIFLLAAATLRITQVSEKYLKAVKLISAVVLLVLGLVMMIKPELLAFA